MIVVNAETELHDWPREQAASHGVSVEEEARSLLRAAYDAMMAAKRTEEHAHWKAVFALAASRRPSAASDPT